MDGFAQTTPKGIVAPINFTAPLSEKPYSYNYDPGPGIPLRNTENEEHGIEVYDARGVSTRCRSTARALSSSITRPRRPTFTTTRSSNPSTTPNASG